MGTFQTVQFLNETPDQAKANAEKILALEIQMSKPRLDRVERRDSKKQYNPTAIADLQKMLPSIDWNTYIKGIGISVLLKVIKNRHYSISQ